MVLKNKDEYIKKKDIYLYMDNYIKNKDLNNKRKELESLDFSCNRYYHLDVPPLSKSIENMSEEEIDYFIRVYTKFKKVGEDDLFDISNKEEKQEKKRNGFFSSVFG